MDPLAPFSVQTVTPTLAAALQRAAFSAGYKWLTWSSRDGPPVPKYVDEGGMYVAYGFVFTPEDRLIWWKSLGDFPQDIRITCLQAMTRFRDEQQVSEMIDEAINEAVPAVSPAPTGRRRLLRQASRDRRINKGGVN